MDLQLNATRRSTVNDSVYLVFDLEAIQISGAVENELFILDSFLQRVVAVNAKPTNLLECKCCVLFISHENNNLSTFAFAYVRTFRHKTQEKFHLRYILHLSTTINIHVSIPNHVAK